MNTPSTDYMNILRLEPHPANIRQGGPGDVTELADSIIVHGILEPLIVTPKPGSPGRYLVVAGNRRLAAARLAGVDELPVIIRQQPGPEGTTVLMLVENCQRADLSPVEKAEAMGRLRARGWTQARIAQQTGLTAGTVSHYLALLDLDGASRARVASGQIRPQDAIAAVRQTRARDRKARGERPQRRRPVTIGPDTFTDRHPLAGKVRARCELAGHTARKIGESRAGRFGCGECWEAEIRADQSARDAAGPAPAGAAPAPVFRAAAS